MYQIINKSGLSVALDFFVSFPSIPERRGEEVSVLVGAADV